MKYKAILKTEQIKSFLICDFVDSMTIAILLNWNFCDHFLSQTRVLDKNIEVSLWPFSFE